MSKPSGADWRRYPHVAPWGDPSCFHQYLRDQRNAVAADLLQVLRDEQAAASRVQP